MKRYRKLFRHGGPSADTSTDVWSSRDKKYLGVELITVPREPKSNALTTEPHELNVVSYLSYIAAPVSAETGNFAQLCEALAGAREQIL